MDRDTMIIEEAKDQFKDIANGIENSKKRSWQLLAFVIALDVFLIQSVATQSILPPSLQLISLVSIPFSMYICYRLYSGITPSKLRDMGVQPEMFDSMKNDNDLAIIKELHKMYNNSIKTNKKILITLTYDYKQALGAIIILVVLSAIISILLPILS